MNLTQTNASELKDLVLLGGGHSHVAVLKMFGMQPMPGVRLTLVSKDVWTPYSGMLPGYIAGHYSFEEAHIDLRPLCRFAGARFIKADVTGLDLADNRVLLPDRPGIKFDTLSINIGSTPRKTDVPGASEHALPIKPIERFLEGWHRVTEQASGNRLRVVVVGGGAGGVELALCCQQRLFSDKPEFHLVADRDVLLASHNKATQAKFTRILRERGIAVHLGHAVVAVDKNKVICEGGATLPFDALLWVTDAAAPGWLKEAGLAVDARGFVSVNDCLQSISHPNVFAAGDIAAVQNHPRPKSGVFAVRQGMPLARNLRAAMCDELPRPFKPQKHFLSIISTGDQCAIASRNWWAVGGAWVWKVKDWIDRRWMRKYQEVPVMATAEAEMPMRCGGCGGKVGGTVLSRALARVEANTPAPVPQTFLSAVSPTFQSADCAKSGLAQTGISAPQAQKLREVVLGLDAREDVSAIHVPPGQTLIQSVDFFRTFLDDPFVFGRVTTNHCLNDIYAKGAEPHSALATVTIPFGPAAQVEEELVQVLSGAVAELRRHNAILLGGHSAEGAELGFGLTVNAFADAATLLPKSGLQPGQALILTKALGTGCLFAADMRHQARGQWIEEALRSMLLSGREAMHCLRRHGATACTDVTGFGLLGHLLEMLTASGASAELSLTALPILNGAAECIRAGIVSSLHPENLRFRHALANPDQPPAILFDPQTAGGLLAGIPAAHAESCVAELRKLCYASASNIGKIISAQGLPKLSIMG